MMNTFNEEAFSTMLQTSEFLALLKPLKNKSVPSRLFDSAVRTLTQEEISDLTAQGNRCADWSCVMVSADFSTQYITGNIITGPCIFGSFTDTHNTGAGSILPPGVHNSILAHTEIGNNCKVYSCTISNYILHSEAIVHNIGSLTCSSVSSFGNGIVVPVGIEAGGRDVRSFAELSFDLATAVAMRRNDAAFLSAFDRFVDAYVAECRTGIGSIGSNCICMNTPVIADACIVGAVTIQGATVIKNATIMGTPKAPTIISHGAVIENSCINNGCFVSTHAIVYGSVLTQHVHAQRHANIVHSIIAHNTEIAEGEVTASLVGPFVGFHHQALLIGAVWPEGKGNIAYGANVGSNHTSKAPDQEIFCGEGVFFGLGTNIKFPANYAEASYSIIATGVTTLPQRIRFPFSLIRSPASYSIDLPGAYNELLPGWVLSDNMYMVKRNEEKFRHRSRVRIKSATFDVFRQDIIKLMHTGRDILSSISTIKNVYTDKDIDGIGKNFMTEKSRQNGIEAYTTFIEYYALKGLKLHVEQMVRAQLPVTNQVAYAAEEPYTNQLELLISEGYCSRTVEENLRRFADLAEYIAQATHRACEKDELRGRKIIPDYNDAHTVAAKDPVVQAMWENAHTIRGDVEMLIKKIKP